MTRIWPLLFFGFYCCVHEVGGNCSVKGHEINEGKMWILQTYFNVTCNNSRIEVLNCLTDSGTQIPLGTLNFEEQGFNYTCKRNALFGYAPALLEQPEAIEEAEECEQGHDDYLRAGFVISCQRNEILGCADAFGDLVKEGFYVADRMSLRYCYVYKNKRRGKIERRGCFKGSQLDDPADSKYHLKRGQLWKKERFTFRCEEDGLQVYKCHPGVNQMPHVGTAWFDKDNVLNFCQFN